MAKKLEMVEAELQRLRAQQTKQASLLRARQASERRVKELENEIETIKANKVALMRRQREEAELHRLQKRERENELRMLRRKEEKTNAQLLKLEEEHAKQAIVLKRKSEEIIAQQKRLRMHESVAAGGAKPRVSVGASRSSCTPRVPPSTAAQVAKLENKRTEEMGRAGDTIYSKPREWLAGEIDAVMLVKDLQAQIQTQIAQRRATQLKLNALEEHHKQAGKEMSDLQSMATSDADVEAVCSEAAAARQAEVEALGMKVEHHNTELQKLQSRLLRCETDEKKTLTKIESLSNINHSKAVLKHAIPQLVQLRVAAKRSEQILAVKVSAMNTQQELISALQAEVEKQRKQGAAEQLQLMEQLQQLQQELDAVRAAPVEEGGNLASRTLTTESEAATAAMLDKRLQALKKAAAAPNAPPAVRDEPESEQQESENESEEDFEESDDDDASDSSDVDWLASEDAKAQLPRSILSKQSINATSGLADATLDVGGDAPLPLRKARRTTASSKQLVHLESEENESVGSGVQSAREAVKQQSAALAMVRGERPRAESNKTSEKVGNKSDSMRMEKSNKGDEVPVAKVDLSKAMVESEKRKALGSLDSNSLEKQRGRSKRDDEPPLKEPIKRKLYNATVVREAF
ncbi:hypothetical protein AB1Y20_008182 [Prymnesium parvum]|uniref:Uncharacterized protein n=1 Tax=Prymnesium parvum TaxID=97485 RepID=A0AB34IVW1_PRYPA